MRKIKFREWDKHREEIYGKGHGMSYGEREDFDDMVGWRFAHEEGLGEEPRILMQYTGLKDKKGREIYEGDILYYTVFDRYDNDKQYKGIVKWSIDDAWWFLANIDDSDFQGSDYHPLGWVWQQDDEPVVIGNIYENTELLKEGQTNG
jgi:uncharacterized phage protein (TIGR01671 family)